MNESAQTDSFDSQEFMVERLRALQPDGTLMDIAIRVGKPVEDTASPHPGTFVCAVRSNLISPSPRLVYGVGPLQSMHLAMMFLRVHLELEESRGVQYFWQDQDVRFDWRSFWYGEKTTLDHLRK